ncbi:MAG: hypothetical protein CSB44_04015 [Gammaproteobacteria bacterium]|nr:MAG: hypothetical protein CSB44_04015 [Gammaproteobacteria bacterium]
MKQSAGEMKLADEQPSEPRASGAEAFDERAVVIDESTALVGIVHGVDKGHGRPAVVLINAGFLHRVGPNRLNTDLARKLGEEGFCSIRIDISGLGDSGPRTDVSDNLELVSTDLDRAMDFLEHEHGYRRFVLMGLCSGAYDTLRKAEHDERVIGLVNLDGTGYRTARFYIHHVLFHLLPRSLEAWRWQRLWKRYRDSRRQGRNHDDAQAIESGSAQRAGFMSLLAFTDLSREQSGQLIEKLASRGVKMHFVFSGGVSGYYNYHGQFDDTFRDFDFRGMVSHRYFPDNDHLNMLQIHRDAVHRDIVDWAVRSFGIASPVGCDAQSGRGDDAQFGRGDAQTPSGERKV